MLARRTGEIGAGIPPPVQRGEPLERRKHVRSLPRQPRCRTGVLPDPLASPNAPATAPGMLTLLRRLALPRTLCVPGAERDVPDEKRAGLSPPACPPSSRHVAGQQQSGGNTSEGEERATVRGGSVDITGQIRFGADRPGQPTPGII